jgi:hypothetical protein
MVTSFRGNKNSQVNYTKTNSLTNCFYALKLLSCLLTMFEGDLEFYISKIWSRNIKYFIEKLIDFCAENLHLGTRLGYPVSVLLQQKQF